jgi:hypothetical protein
MGQRRKENAFMREIEDLENVVFVCFGQPGDHDLPQIPDEEGLLIDLMQCLTGEPYNQVEAQLHHQIDPSYSSAR